MLWIALGFRLCLAGPRVEVREDFDTVVLEPRQLNYPRSVVYGRRRYDPGHC